MWILRLGPAAILLYSCHIVRHAGEGWEITTPVLVTLWWNMAATVGLVLFASFVGCALSQAPGDAW